MTQSNLINEILDAITITSPTTYLYDGIEYSNNADDSGSYFDLTDMIYHIFHCRNLLVHNSEEYTSNEELLETFSQHNTGIGTWDIGWTITGTYDGQLLVEKDGLVIWATPEEFMNLNDTQEIGCEGLLFIQKEYRLLNSGFYMALSDATFSYQSPHVKIYWNIQIDAAALLLYEITYRLNEKEIPFRFKILNNKNSYPRSDAAVLYVDIENIPHIQKSLCEIYNEVKEFLNPSTSLFAKRLAPGIGLAEDVIDDEGFGYRTSRIIAESMIECYRKQISIKREIRMEIDKVFKKRGLSLTCPYLNQDSINNYEQLSGFT
ncbi:T3SS effector HopA1 family protein [Nitrosopumilus ureiphilus]|uniref:Uncharacterized protein n=1 Tax=Nitrosopumilus ureiphilus TaxID=1470067 RepID=A0A7D5RD06_9ARCH|nr:T3SS effector HopA1 family protein [Nitrosopumilus ureiphilus]QLH06301.1 hypothetical protein C5F50_03825 [Nitrosopumilus ureiphilus]